MLVENPSYPSLRFKKLRGQYWSVRIGREWRALAIQSGPDYSWFWIGRHDEYERIIGSL